MKTLKMIRIIYHHNEDISIYDFMKGCLKALMNTNPALGRFTNKYSCIRGYMYLETSFMCNYNKF